MRLFPAKPPPGPFRPGFFRSPLRGPWLTSLLGSLLLVAMFLVSITGLLSHAAYQPDLGANAIVPTGADAPWLNIGWPTHPSWLYALTQGTHVTLGIIAVPLLLAKLWSVIPRLFAWPPVASPAQALERLSLLALVGGALFQFATGIVNAQVYYPFKFGFVTAHYYGAWVFMSALVIHVLVKLPTIRRAYRERGVLKPLRESLEQTRPEPYDPDGLVSERPAEPTLSRRGLLGVVGAMTAGLFVVTAGQSIGGPLRRTALLAPRGRVRGNGPNDFEVNKTAATAKITPKMTGDGYRLKVQGRKTVELSRAQLLALPQHTEHLPIACVEGWSTTQAWTGVRLRDLAVLAGMPASTQLHVGSLQEAGALRQATLESGQVADERSLLALKVNGADLSPDHGYPARVIVPALPGVHCTKWVATLDFRA
ncbi:MAG: molybdopterin-dependent oxidoreductase [Solirubrobacteraceae bacterium]